MNGTIRLHGVSDLHPPAPRKGFWLTSEQISNGREGRPCVLSIRFPVRHCNGRKLGGWQNAASSSVVYIWEDGHCMLIVMVKL